MFSDILLKKYEVTIVSLSWIKYIQSGKYVNNENKKLGCKINIFLSDKNSNLF
jgi:hypothetical protein